MLSDEALVTAYLASGEAAALETLVSRHLVPDASALRTAATLVSIMVDSELRLPGPVPLQVVAGGVQNSGVPTRVYAVRQGDGNYEVYQTVALLKDKVS